MKNILIDNVNLLAKQKNLLNNSGKPSQSGIAARANKKGFPVDQKTIGRALDIDGGDVTTRVLEAIAAAFDLTVSQLVDATIHHNTSPISPSCSSLPLIDFIQAGDWRNSSSRNEMGIRESIPVYGSAFSDNAFALTVKGESMHPKYKEGDVIFVDPDVPLKPGDLVVAKLDQETAATFKKYKSRGFDDNNSEIIELSPINEDYPTLKINSKNPGHIIGKVVGRFEAY